MDIPERIEALPAGAKRALTERYGDQLWTVVHAWVNEDSVLAVVSVAPESAFEEDADAFDVDIVELHLLRMFDTLQGWWDVASDQELRLGTLFEDFVQDFFERTEGTSSEPT